MLGFTKSWTTIANLAEASLGIPVKTIRSQSGQVENKVILLNILLLIATIFSVLAENRRFKLFWPPFYGKRDNEAIIPLKVSTLSRQ